MLLLIFDFIFFKYSQHHIKLMYEIQTEKNTKKNTK